MQLFLKKKQKYKAASVGFLILLGVSVMLIYNLILLADLMHKEEVSPNASLADAPPTDLRIAFIGDSISRHHYQSLAYFLQWGRWNEDFSLQRVAPIYNTNGKRDDVLYNNTTRLIIGDQCDCFPGDEGSKRKWAYLKTYAHNRYFLHDDNLLVYIAKMGDMALARGHWDVTDVHQSHELAVGPEPYTWQYDWDKVIRHHLANLRPKPEYVVLNAGLWRHNDLTKQRVRQGIQQALKDTNMTGIYRTTTFMVGQNYTDDPNDYHHGNDGDMCRDIQFCMNVSWTAGLASEYYVDSAHFVDSVNNKMAMQLLELIAELKKDKQSN